MTESIIIDETHRVMSAEELARFGLEIRAGWTGPMPTPLVVYVTTFDEEC